MNIAIYTMRAIAGLLTDPLSLVMLFILGIILFRQNRKVSIMQKMILGKEVDSAFELTISQVVIGIIAGTVASVVLSYLGVMFSENSLVYLIFLISLVFMFIDPRYVCFSYSGAVLGMASFLLENVSKLMGVPNMDPFKIDIVSLMTMIAVFHIIEGILVIVDGKRGAIPVFTNREDKIVGGFVFKRYWALPIALIFLVTSKGLVDTTCVHFATPNWWPLIKSATTSQILKAMAISMVPFYGMIGYSSITFTKSKQRKSVSAGMWILSYGAVLFVAAQLASLNVVLEFLVLIIAPLGHELMLNHQKHKEINDNPKYISDEGLMVLDVCPDSLAMKMKIASGDIILKINQTIIDTEAQLLEALKESSNFITVKVKRENGKIEDLCSNSYNAARKLGIIYVPKLITETSKMVKLNESRFREVLDKVTNKITEKKPDDTGNNDNSNSVNENKDFNKDDNDNNDEKKS